MIIRPAAAADWPLIWPFFRSIVEAGHSYAFPQGLTLESARPWWDGAPARG